MFFSASNLVKQSAKQICYLRNKEKEVSQWQINGNTMSSSKISGLKEMRGLYKFDDHIIFYCFDEIINTKNVIKLIEYKSDQFNNISDYYLNKSIIQVALYFSLAKENYNKKYVTAKFLIDEGAKKQEFILDKKLKNILNIGGKTFVIKVKNRKKILDYYFNKSIASLNYCSASEWDKDCKEKEIDYLLQFIRYNEERKK